MALVLVAAWACDFCGYEGRHTGPDTVDALQYPVCGEPVTLVAEWWAEADG